MPKSYIDGSYGKFVSSFYGEGVLVKVSIALIKHHDQKQRGGDRLYFSLYFPDNSPSLIEVRAKTQAKQEPGCKN